MEIHPKHLTLNTMNPYGIAGGAFGAAWGPRNHIKHLDHCG